MKQGELFKIYEEKLPPDELISKTLAVLIDHLSNSVLAENNVITWGCPVLAFGDVSRSKIATLGLNPSNKEFVDDNGNELEGVARRFHTLKSLEINSWTDIEDHHLDLIYESCCAYFYRNPYDRWFKKLDQIIAGTNISYYDNLLTACHLDLIPYATECKWAELSYRQRTSLMNIAGDSLGFLIKNSPLEVLILNGQSVVNQFQETANICLQKEEMPDWDLPRRSQVSVKGIAYKGFINKISGISIEREILVLGFNHNIQSSFGVTKQVTIAIKNWITKEFGELNL